MQKKNRRPNFYELDNVNLTALRILVIFDMLLKAPCDISEINEKLEKEVKDCKKLSRDTICIYLNTLRVLGCVISRPTKNNDFKYNLVSHPFQLSLTEKEVETLIELRKYFSTLCEWRTTVEIDNLFNKILENLTSSTQKLFQSAKKNILCREVTSEKFLRSIKQLEKYCKQNKTLTLLYKSPESGEKNITLNAEEITMENGAFYLWGYSDELETTMYLRVDRILDIKTVSLRHNKIERVFFKAIYKLKTGSDYPSLISEKDRMLERSGDEFIIETTVSNKFRFFQKILSYGSDCTVLHPEKVREEIALNLANILKIYDETALVSE